MATFATTDYVVTVGGVDLSDHVRQASTDITVEELDDTAMGDDSRSKIGGLRDASVTLEFNQDFAASEVDATLWPLLGTVTNVVVRPVSGAVSSTNPQYTFPVLVTQHAPFANSVGDLATMSVTWPGSGTVLRATST